MRGALAGSGRALPSSSAVPRGWGPPWCLMGTTTAQQTPLWGVGTTQVRSSLLSTGAVTLSADLQLKLSSLSQRLSVQSHHPQKDMCPPSRGGRQQEEGGHAGHADSASFRLWVPRAPRPSPKAKELKKLTETGGPQPRLAIQRPRDPPTFSRLPWTKTESVPTFSQTALLGVRVVVGDW